MSRSLAPESPLRDRALERINRRYDQFLAAGYPLAAHPPETIQCRSDLDRTNWFELRDICRGVIEAERQAYADTGQEPPAVLGDYPITAPGIRCTSNAYVLPTVAGTLDILAGLRDWVMAAQINHWRLKDAVRDAPTREALLTIDPEEGWP